MNIRTIFLVLSTACVSQIASALDATAWMHQQPFTATEVGITRLELPAETLNASRLQFEDIRLLTPSGTESPFIIERASLRPPRSAAVRNFKSSIADGITLVELETGSVDAIEAVVLDTPSANFIKAARVEASSDGTQWNEIAKNEVVFRQPGGASRLRISFASASHLRLRITFDDKRTLPVPFTGASIEYTDQNPSIVSQGAVIAQTVEKPRETALTVDLGAANLHIAILRLLVSDPVFSRRVKVSYAHDDNGTTRYTAVGSEVIYRVTTNDGLSTKSLEVPIHQLLPTAKLTVTIDNGDSPPLHVSGIEATRQPVSLIFFAPETGAWKLITGNSTIPAPSYDLGALDKQLRQGNAARAHASALAANADYKEPTALPNVRPEGANIELKKYRYRRSIASDQTGVLRVELDAETLAHAQTSLADLRVVQNEKQIPFLVDRTNAIRSIDASIAKESDPKRRTVSLWKVTMPLNGLPASRLSCTSSTGLFERAVTVWEKLKDSMGNEYRAEIGTAHWTRQSGIKENQFSVSLKSGRLPEGFFVETDNGDNPPIEIADVKLHYGVSAVVAKLIESAPVFLYFGNDEAFAPRYDLQLVRAELLAAQKQNATLGKEEILQAMKKASPEVTAGSPWLWAALGVVIIALLWVVAKMLPKAGEVVK